jgi:hypothetical protein
MPIRNMDCFFKLGQNTFTVGAVSPLNSGWYVAIPDKKAFEYMREKVCELDLHVLRSVPSLTEPNRFTSVTRLCGGSKETGTR